MGEERAGADAGWYSYGGGRMPAAAHFSPVTPLLPGAHRSCGPDMPPPEPRWPGLPAEAEAEEDQHELAEQQMPIASASSAGSAGSSLTDGTDTGSWLPSSPVNTVRRLIGRASDRLPLLSPSIGSGLSYLSSPLWIS
jgi:hypothetical protein